MHKTSSYTFRIWGTTNFRSIQKHMDMPYKYKEAFSLRDEIGTCPSIEVEMNIMENPHSLFVITM